MLLILVDCVLLCFWKLRPCELLRDAPHGHQVFLPEWTCAVRIGAVELQALVTSCDEGFFRFCRVSFELTLSVGNSGSGAAHEMFGSTSMLNGTVTMRVEGTRSFNGELEMISHGSI